MQIINVGPHERVIKHHLVLPGEAVELQPQEFEALNERYPGEFEPTGEFQAGAAPRSAAGFERTTVKPADGGGRVALTDLNGVGPATAKKMESAGIGSANMLAGVTDLDAVAEATGLSRSSLQDWQDQARGLLRPE